MNQDLQRGSPDGVEGAEDVQSVGGAEPEDGLVSVQHDEGLQAERCVRGVGASEPL